MHKTMLQSHPASLDEVSLLGAHLSSLFKPWKAAGTPWEWFRFSATLWKDLIFTEQKKPSETHHLLIHLSVPWAGLCPFTDVWEKNLWRRSLADVLKEVIQSLGLSDPDIHLPSSVQLQNIWLYGSNTQCTRTNLVPLCLTRYIDIIETFWAGMLISIDISTTLLPNNFHCFKNVTSCRNCHHNTTRSVPAADTNSLALGLLSWLPLQTGLPPYFLLEELHHEEGWSSPMIEKFLAPLHHRSSPGHMAAGPRPLTSQTPGCGQPEASL